MSTHKQRHTHTHARTHTHTPDYSVEGALGRSNAQALHYAAGRPALSPGQLQQDATDREQVANQLGQSPKPKFKGVVVVVVVVAVKCLFNL